ncbi:MAG: hypothetical protein JO093_16100 [Acidobacteria bacterium]|nr:hypothetical protein [Acidobacteriota bacterium]MBV9069369.1 hypothetical protein [Acidobacteriota bacterium]MBV9187139.1 hypothetical protein [Acidobacteriota bacterium]
MAKDPRSQVQQVIDGRSKAETSAAATANIVNFQDWLFFGTEPDIFVNVGIVPTSSSIAVTYGLVVFQTPDKLILGNATIGTSNAQGGWAMNLALAMDNYSIQQFGDQIQAWAFAQIANGQSQYSSVQNFTVT